MTKSCPNFYFSYFGNKRREVKYFENIDFDKYDRIVEPFAGSAAFSRWLYFCKGYKDKTYILNDIDEQLIGILNYVRVNGSEGLLNWTNEKMVNNISKPEYLELIKKKDKDLNEYFFMRKTSTHGNMYPIRQIGKAYKNDSNKLNDEFYKSPNVNLSCEDYRNVIEKYKDDPKTLIFLDPPYFESHNTEYSININEKHSVVDNTGYYINSLHLMKEKAGVLLIINSNELMDYVFRDYIKKTYDFTYSITRRKVRHHIVGNVDL